ncbi:MAG TPA: class I SAM-dependent methyltransferase [Pyrinomonadaceae bacterium]|jgi:ubiquinone/menaquinone biosynthesis C-methylase UbiE|nr:class I SAM-dependent methyltransferase [Pyrinomonadaceae bacterium]
MAEADGTLKERVRAFWQANPCGVKFADAEVGTREFFARVEAHRYGSEWHIPSAAGFSSAKGLRVLEIGCGLGTDGAGFARAGAIYTGVDLTAAAVELARRRFELEGLRGEFRVADAEALEFADESFDLVYSHGVLHHTPDIGAAVGEVHRVLRPGGRAVVMVYHRDSYNYRVNIGMLRRAGAHLLRGETGLRVAHRLTGEPLESLREHAARIREDTQSYLKPEEFLSRNTDGAGNPLTRVYSRGEARELFKEFAEVELAVHYLNKRWLPLVGPLLPRAWEARLASRWGWHLWIYARKGVAAEPSTAAREGSTRLDEKESLLNA